MTKFGVGTKVWLNGYKGTVTRVVPWSKTLREVRLPGGLACVGVSDLKYYKGQDKAKKRSK